MALRWHLCGLMSKRIWKLRCSGLDLKFDNCRVKWLIYNAVSQRCGHGALHRLHRHRAKRCHGSEGKWSFKTKRGHTIGHISLSLLGRLNLNYRLWGWLAFSCYIQILFMYCCQNKVWHHNFLKSKKSNLISCIHIIRETDLEFLAFRKTLLHGDTVENCSEQIKLKWTFCHFECWENHLKKTDSTDLGPCNHCDKQNAPSTE